MARRRPWPRIANDHRLATIAAAREERRILDDTDTWKEVDPELWRRIKQDLKVIFADIITWQTLAKFGEPEESIE